MSLGRKSVARIMPSPVSRKRGQRPRLLWSNRRRPHFAQTFLLVKRTVYGSARECLLNFLAFVCQSQYHSTGFDTRNKEGMQLDNRFFEKPILNSPYEHPSRRWELDETGQPIQKIVEGRRLADFINPIPKPKKRRGGTRDTGSLFDEGLGLSSPDQKYDHTALITSVRQQVEGWRNLPNPNQWQVTAETAWLLQHWRHHQFSGIRPFFCQVEAVETAI